MNTIKFLIVVSIALLSTDLIYHQVVYGQTADDFIQKYKADKAKDLEYRTELINKIENSTCLDFPDYKKIPTKEEIQKDGMWQWFLNHTDNSGLEEKLKYCIGYLGIDIK